MHIWVDADSCPRMVRSYILRYASRLALPAIFVANHQIPVSENSAYKMIICEKTPDAADNYIVLHSETCDMVVTRDIPLAARCVEKNICVLNDRGTVYTKENVQQRLSERNFSLQLAQIGLCSSGTITYGKKEFAAFANSFDKEIHQLIRKAELAE
ncbi:MAG: DUF188 domain-containing protein [Treponema sp.]